MFFSQVEKCVFFVELDFLKFSFRPKNHFFSSKKKQIYIFFFLHFFQKKMKKAANQNRDNEFFQKFKNMK